MSLQGPIVIVAERPAAGLVHAFTAAGAFPIIEARWPDAPAAVHSIKPSAVVVTDPNPADPAAAEALARCVAEAEPYLPLIARMRDDSKPMLPNALPIAADAPVERIVARLGSALRLRTLHATVLGRARTLKDERNIIAEMPPGDPL